MTKKEAIDTLEKFLDAFYEFPDWHVLSMIDTEAIETLIEEAKKSE